MSGPILDLVWKVAAPVVSGAAGVAGTIWKITKDLENRVRKLEREELPPDNPTGKRIGALEEFKKKIEDEKEGLFAKAKALLEAFKSEKYAVDLAGLKKLVDDLKTDVDKDIEDLYGEMRGRSKERLEARRLQTKLSERYLAIEGRVEAVEKAISSLNTQFVDFARGQNEQWQDIERALGNIEGWIRATTRRNSSEFSAPKLPPKKTP